MRVVLPANNFIYCPMCATPLVEKHIYQASRLTCPACNYINFLEPKLVAVVVVEHEGMILLGRRNMEPSRGLWTFIGGFVERGEKVEDAAIREVKEETNLDVQLEGLLGIYSGPGNPHVVLAFRASIINGDTSQMTSQPDEISELVFFSPREIPEMAFPSSQQILQAWLNT